MGGYQTTVPASEIRPEPTAPPMARMPSVAHSGERDPGQTMQALLQQMTAMQSAPAPTPPDVTPEMADAIMAHGAAVTGAAQSTTPQVTLNEPFSSKLARVIHGASQAYDMGAMSPEERQRARELQASREEQKVGAVRAEGHAQRAEEREQQRLEMERENAYHTRRLADAQQEIRQKIADMDVQIKAHQLRAAKEMDPIKRQNAIEDIKHKQYLRDVYLPGELNAKNAEAGAAVTRAKVLKEAGGRASQGYTEDTTEVIPGTNTPISEKHVVKTPTRGGASAGPQSQPQTQQNAAPQPGTHQFSIGAWKAANPNGDVNAAIAAAEQQRFAVVP